MSPNYLIRIVPYFEFNVVLVYTCFRSNAVSTCPTIFVTTCPKAMFFIQRHAHAASMNIFMHSLCSVVTHYILHVSAIFFYKPVFIIDCTRRKIVNMRITVSGV